MSTTIGFVLIQLMTSSETSWAWILAALAYDIGWAVAKHTINKKAGQPYVDLLAKIKEIQSK